MVDESGERGNNYPLYWEPTYEIVLALMEAHPAVNFDEVGLYQMYDWIIALPNFADDPRIASDELLRDIFREWYEEADEARNKL